jgi:hypothetical protein
MLTALIAQQNLTNTTLNAVTPLIQYLATDYPESPEFLSSACWADDLRQLGDPQNLAWHYIDLPYVREALWTGIPAVDNTSDVSWALKSQIYLLTSSASKTVDRARSLRFLIHFSGDSHQPLHAASMYDQALFPKGDAGGNFYKIKGANQSELHAFFDSGAGQWQDDPDRPLSPQGLQYLEGWAQQLTTNYPPSFFGDRLEDTNPEQWVIETHRLAVEDAYATPYEGVLLKTSLTTRALFVNNKLRWVVIGLVWFSTKSSTRSSRLLTRFRTFCSVLLDSASRRR